jgi:hypothetical protein
MALTLLFVLTTIICAVGWLTYWVGSAALAKYMMDKGYTPPSENEMKECSTYVWKKLLHIR